MKRVYPIRADQRSRKPKATGLSARSYVDRVVFAEHSGYTPTQKLVALAIASHLSPCHADRRNWVSFPSVSRLAKSTGYGQNAVSRSLQAIKRHPVPLFKFDRPPEGKKLITNGHPHACYRFTLIYDPGKFAEKRDAHAEEMARVEDIVVTVVQRMVDAVSSQRGLPGGAAERGDLEREARTFIQDALRAKFAWDTIYGSLQDADYGARRVVEISTVTVRLRWPSNFESVKFAFDV